VIRNFSLARSVLSRNHGLATFVHERLEWSLVDQSPEQSEIEWLCVDVAGFQIINVYKLPRSRFTPTAIPTFPHPSLYVGDFNCQHVNWGYNKTSPEGVSMDSWATTNNLGLLYNSKGNSQLLSPIERRQQPRPGLREFRPGQTCPRKVPAVSTSAFPQTLPKFKVSDHSDPVKRWNFRKADWKCFCLLTDASVQRLPPPDSSNIERTFLDFCESLLSVAK